MLAFEKLIRDEQQKVMEPFLNDDEYYPIHFYCI